jgi:hypothetical protein
MRCCGKQDFNNLLTLILLKKIVSTLFFNQFFKGNRILIILKNIKKNL